MNFEFLIPILPLRRPGFSRVRRSRQSALSRQASHRLKPGLPVLHIRTIFSTFIRWTPGLEPTA